MYYAIMSEDVENSLPLRTRSRAAHIQRLKEMAAQDRIVLAGPLPAIDSIDPGEAGFTGSLIAAQFATLEAAQAWANADPYVTAGVTKKVTVKPFKKVLP